MRKELKRILIHSVSLYLDPQIRDWVLFPITLVMVRFVDLASLILLMLFTDIGRNFATLCSSSSPVAPKEAAQGGHP